ncbi:MAG: GNAT family N-acetyltransferase [Roseovarius sp.]
MSVTMAFYQRPSTGPCAALATRMQAVVPVLTTARLTLRAPMIEDFTGFAQMVLGPRGAHFGAPATAEEAWAIFLQMTGAWYLRGHGAWAVTLSDTGALLGFVQIGAEPGDREPELGWILSEEAEGKGYAREAAEAVRAQAFGPFALPSLVSYVDGANTRSLALAERLGATRDRAEEAALAPILAPGESLAVYRHHPEGGPR